MPNMYCNIENKQFSDDLTSVSAERVVFIVIPKGFIYPKSVLFDVYTKTLPATDC